MMESALEMSQFTLKNYNLRSKVRVHPLVLYQIVDAHERRPKGAHHVYGTLLGRYDDDGHIELTNSFTIVHKESESQLNLDVQYNIDMVELNKLSYPDEELFGWYSTDHKISSAAVALHDYYARQCLEPLHLLVDGSLRGKRMSMQLYSAVEIGVPRGTRGLMFTMVPMELHCSDFEWSTVGRMQKHALSKHAHKPLRQLPELLRVVESTCSMEQHLDIMLQYVNDVLARKRRPDTAVGRALHAVLNSVPLLDGDSFRLMFNANVRDMLMSICLSMLMRSQLQINEKLSSLPNHCVPGL